MTIRESIEGTKQPEEPKVLPFNNKNYRRPWRNPRLGLALTKFIAPAIPVAAVALILFAWVSAGKFIPTVLIPAFIANRLLKALGKSLIGAELDDKRAPIVFLREFSGEGSVAQVGHLINNFEETATVEEYLQMALYPIGPLVALGKPGAWLQKAGANRKYVADFQWRREIAQMIDKSRLVLIQAGDSKFFLEEVARATKRKAPNSILISDLLT